MVKKWSEMSKFERIKYGNYGLVFCALYLGVASVYSFFNHWVALPCGVLAVVFVVYFEHEKSRKILLDELGSVKR